MNVCQLYRDNILVEHLTYSNQCHPLDCSIDICFLPAFSNKILVFSFTWLQLMFIFFNFLFIYFIYLFLKIWLPSRASIMKCGCIYIIQISHQRGWNRFFVERSWLFIWLFSVWLFDSPDTISCKIHCR